MAPVVIDLFHFKYEEYITSGNDFVTCLVTASYMAPQPQTQDSVNSFAFDTCGEIPKDRPNKTALFSVLVWATSFGTIPALVFGCAGNGQKAIKLIITTPFLFIYNVFNKFFNSVTSVEKNEAKLNVTVDN